MYVTLFSLCIVLITKIYGISIPFIQDVFLQPSSDSNLNITVSFNRSCKECLCEQFISNNNINYVALNCFLNGTCLFLPTFPLSYGLVSSAGTRLYFLQNQFPNTTQCCMPNITELLIRLQNAVPMIMNLTFQPAAFGYDPANPYEAAVCGWNVPIIYFFNPITMMFIRNASINSSLTLTLYNNQTFAATSSTPIIYIQDSQTRNYLADISFPTLGAVRKLIFINNGQTMIVPTQNNNSLTIFNVNSPLNYTFQQQVLLPFTQAHGIAKVNDTLLYVSSWGSQSIASYTYENLTWTYKIFVNHTVTGSGAHLAVDECERVWFVNTHFGLRIYDSSGIEIGNWNMSLTSGDPVYDILFLPNYVLLITHYQTKKIVVYDPQLTCP